MKATMRMLVVSVLSVIGLSMGETASTITDGNVTLICGADISPSVCKYVAGFVGTSAKKFTVHVGATSVARTAIGDDELQSLPPESFIIREITECESASFVFAVRGTAHEPRYRAPTGSSICTGCHFGLLSLISDHLHVAHFIHPLLPARVVGGWSDPTELCSGTGVRESPRWPIRGFHIHTQHPIELLDVLNGLDASTHGETPTIPDVSWETMFLEVEHLFAWLVAHRQNSVEWALLYSREWWQPGLMAERRLHRLRKLTDLAHNWGLRVGVTATVVGPFQQHAFYFVDLSNATQRNSEIEAQLSIHRHLDLLLGTGDGEAGFDMLSTENGAGEFAHPPCEVMLRYLNQTAEYARDRHGKECFIKCHITDGATCPGFNDPIDNGKSANFNFLPIFADENMGVMPHPVQTYAFDDPAGMTYGNRDFTKMLDFAVEAARRSHGRRSVLYFGESAYWVQFDISVPLFLPLYGERRLHDLRLLAQKERQYSISFSGQMDFSSGWEWGYWVGDLVTARAAWDPGEDMSDAAALAHSLQPIKNLFGHGLGSKIVVWLTKTIIVQHKLMICGEPVDDLDRWSGPVAVEPCSNHDTVLLNGHAYLQGWDTWSHLEALGYRLGLTDAFTQPDRLDLRELLQPKGGMTPAFAFIRGIVTKLGAARPAPSYASSESVKDGQEYYTKRVAPLLDSLASTFRLLTDELEQIRETETIPKYARSLFDSMADGIEITALRAEQLRALYRAAYSAGKPGHHVNTSTALLLEAKQATIAASAIVARREEHYAVAAWRIAGWRGKSQPSCNQFGFLWTVSNLAFFWRDYATVVGTDLLSYSPCFWNYQTPADVLLGHGILYDITKFIRRWTESVPYLNVITMCVAAPDTEPIIPGNIAELDEVRRDQPATIAGFSVWGLMLTCWLELSLLSVALIARCDIEFNADTTFGRLLLLGLPAPILLATMPTFTALGIIQLHIWLLFWICRGCRGFAAQLACLLTSLLLLPCNALVLVIIVLLAWGGVSSLQIWCALTSIAWSSMLLCILAARSVYLLARNSFKTDSDMNRSHIKNKKD